MNNRDIAQIVLNEGKSEIKKVIEEIKEQNALKERKVKTRTVKEISKIAEADLFSKKSLWYVFNRKNALEFTVDGTYAESYLGKKHEVREALLKGETDCFVNREFFVKFLSCECDA